MVSLHVTEPVALPGSGYLVPKPDQRHVTAASLASRKWAHWQPQGGGSILRVSLGRFGNEVPLAMGDDEVLATAVDEVSRHLGTTLVPRSSRITRWSRSFPQYLPHHLTRIAAIEAALAQDCPGLVVAGAAYRGLGVPACVRQGRDAARRVVEPA